MFPSYKVTYALLRVWQFSNSNANYDFSFKWRDALLCKNIP